MRAYRDSIAFSIFSSFVSLRGFGAAFFAFFAFVDALVLLLPSSTSSSLSPSRKDYVTHPLLTLTLGAGTLLVFASTDDFFYCHEAAFAPDATGTRLAFVFRWMNAMNGSVLFDASSGNMIMTRELREKDAKRKRKRATTAANDRRSSLRAM